MSMRLGSGRNRGKGARRSRRGSSGLLVAVVALLVVACVPDASPPNPVTLPADEPGSLTGLRAVRASTGRIVDASGRDVQLRGVNLNALGDYFQVDPRLPTTHPITDHTWTEMADRGFNVVRLVTTWSAWEPQRDQIDQSYVERVESAVRDANAAGIYVVLDMHQDAWSKEVYTPADVTCPAGTFPQIGWDGAPAWATFTDGVSTCGQGGGPGGREENPAVKAAWRSFYMNRDGIRDELAELWGFIAERFAGNDGIAGYDLLNEPGQTEDVVASNNGLVAYYQSAIGEIRAGEARAGSPPRLVFFEGFLGTAPIVPFDFSNDPDLVFAPHNYAESIGPDLPGLLGVLTDATALLGTLYRTPVWVGEYGAFGGQSAQWYSRFNAAHDRPGMVGGAWWQWNQECGDPHDLSGLWPLGEDEILAETQDCSTATGTTGVSWKPGCEVRSYPIAAPGIAGFEAKPCGGDLRVRGSSSNGTSPVLSRVDLWYQPPAGTPIAAAPTVEGIGAGATTATATPYGWRLSVQVVGDYDLVVAAP